MLVCGCDPLDSCGVRGGDTLQCTGFATHRPFDRYFFLQPTRLRPDSNCFPKISCLGSTSLSRVALVFPRRQVQRVEAAFLLNVLRLDY